MILSSIADERLVARLKNSQVGVLPTDTVYGLVARAADAAAVDRLYRLKHRERKPGTVIAASIDQLVRLGVEAATLHAVQGYWPGPFSVVAPTASKLHYLDHGMGLAVRIPANTRLRQLLGQTGPLLTSSANAPGQPPANTINEARAYFGDQVDFYADGGDLSGQISSTLVRLVDGKFEVLRQGAVKIKIKE